MGNELNRKYLINILINHNFSSMYHGDLIFFDKYNDILLNNSILDLIYDYNYIELNNLYSFLISTKKPIKKIKRVIDESKYNTDINDNSIFTDLINSDSIQTIYDIKKYLIDKCGVKINEFTNFTEFSLSSNNKLYNQLANNNNYKEFKKRKKNNFEFSYTLMKSLNVPYNSVIKLMDDEKTFNELNDLSDLKTQEDFERPSDNPWKPNRKLNWMQKRQSIYKNETDI